MPLSQENQITPTIHSVVPATREDAASRKRARSSLSPSKSSSPPRTALEGADPSKLKRRSSGKGTTAVINHFTTATTDIRKFNDKYLKEHFGFNITTKEFSHPFSYLFIGHPQAIMEEASKTDSRLYHESGVLVKSRPTTQKKEIPEEDHIKNYKYFNFLLSINAFTLSTPEYPFDKSEIDQLLHIYFTKLNSMLPILNEKQVLKAYNLGKLPSIILYGIVLAVLRDKLAEPILKAVMIRGKQQMNQDITDLTMDQFIEEFTTFVTDLDFKIRQILLVLAQLGDDDRYVRLVVHILLSYHFGYERMAEERNSHDVAEAIEYVFATGFHMKATTPTNKSSEISTVFWCCYFMDRVTGIVASRATLIKKEDFNMELPYHNMSLMKLIQLARSLENVMFTMYQPFGNDLQGNNMTRYKRIDADYFQKVEFDILSQDRQKRVCPFDRSNYESCQFHFITRMINNFMVILCQKQKYDTPEIDNRIPDDITLEASSNILWYYRQMHKDDMLNIPMMFTFVSIAMACALKRKANLLLKGKEEEPRFGYVFEDYITALDEYSPYWLYVRNICKVTRNFLAELELKSATRKRKKPKKSVIPQTFAEPLPQGSGNSARAQHQISGMTQASPINMPLPPPTSFATKLPQIQQQHQQQQNQLQSSEQQQNQQSQPPQQLPFPHPTQAPSLSHGSPRLQQPYTTLFNGQFNSGFVGTSSHPPSNTSLPSFVRSNPPSNGFGSSTVSKVNTPESYNQADPNGDWVKLMQLSQNGSPAAGFGIDGSPGISKKGSLLSISNMLAYDSQQQRQQLQAKGVSQQLPDQIQLLIPSLPLPVHTSSYSGQMLGQYALNPNEGQNTNQHANSVDSRTDVQTVDSSSLHEGDEERNQFVDSLKVEFFDNDFFKDVSNVINFWV